MAKSRRITGHSTASASASATTARARNHIILRLRGMYASVSAMAIGHNQIFNQDEIDLIQRTIDQALNRLGAEPESNRRKTWLERRREIGAI